MELTTASGPVRGHFVGIDGRGDLIVQREGASETHSAPYVQMLREVL
ncbi:MAG: hypothetical protein ACKOKC_09390 [Chthoniobacterales bacterium]